MVQMTGTEARAARETLELTREELASETNSTPDVVAAWEDDRMQVPRRIAMELRWRLAHAERHAALEASGLPECGWVVEWGETVVPDTVANHRIHTEALMAHVQSCSLCIAREAYIDKNFPPMPPAPGPAWMTGFSFLMNRIDRLPRWAQPTVVGAGIVILYSLFRTLLAIPSIIESPASGLAAAAKGILAGALIGAALGFLYGQYGILRRRWAARRAAS
jgi:hypothetical protein